MAYTKYVPLENINAQIATETRDPVVTQVNVQAGLFNVLPANTRRTGAVKISHNSSMAIYFLEGDGAAADKFSACVPGLDFYNNLASGQWEPYIPAGKGKITAFALAGDGKITITEQLT